MCTWENSRHKFKITYRESVKGCIKFYFGQDFPNANESLAQYFQSFKVSFNGSATALSTHISYHQSLHNIEFGKKILLYTNPVQNKEISVFSAVCQLISKKIFFFHSTFKRAIFSIYIMFFVYYFLIFFYRNSATSQQNKILSIVL